MVDLDDLMRAELRDRAAQAPDGQQLLAGVHARSGQLRRRRRRLMTAGGLTAAVVALALPMALGGIGGGHPVRPGVTGVPTATADPTGGPSDSTGPAQASAQTTTVPGASGPTAVGLGPGPAAVPAFAFQLAATAATAFDAPIVTLERRALISFYLAKDPDLGADVTLVVTAQRPTFGTAAGSVSEVQQQVRGHAGFLRTVAVSPAAQYTLYWQESASQWVQVRTDDTFTKAEVLRFATGLIGAATPVAAGFRFDYVPLGTTVGTVTPSSVVFLAGPASGSGTDPTVVTCDLRPARALTGTTLRVGSYRATLTKDSGSVVLMVLLTDWQMTLVVEVPAKYTMTDADLIRFAAGVHVTERAESRPAPSGGSSTSIGR